MKNAYAQKQARAAARKEARRAALRIKGQMKKGTQNS